MELELIKQFSDYINKEVADRIAQWAPENPYQSKETKDIDEAFSKAQLEYPSIFPDKRNAWEQTDYAEFNTIMEKIRPVMAKNGLALSQFTVINGNEGGRVLHTRLRHASGQWFESREKIIPEKNDDATYASTLMYKKRHQAMALLGITVRDDKYDDDAAVATLESRKMFAKGTELNTKYDPRNESPETINAHELEELKYELGQYPEIGEDLMKTLRIQSLQDMPKSKYRAAVEKVRNITLARNGLKKS